MLSVGRAFQGGGRQGRGRLASSLRAVAGKGNLNAAVVGCGSSRPSVCLENGELSGFLDTDDEWIRTRTGIQRRRLLAADRGLCELGAEAGAEALANAGVDPSDVDLVIVATSSPDDLFGDATTVAASIGCTNAVGFDLTAACSGFLFALVTGAQFLHSGTYETCLVVGADAMSRWVDWDDRNISILFGDGAGAMVIKRGSPSNGGPGLLGFAMHSDGRSHDKLTLPYAGTPRLLGQTGKDVSDGAYGKMTMAGKSVYVFAVSEVPKVLAEALDNAGLSVDDVDWVLLHQANIRIMESVAERLGVPMSKVIANLEDCGNTSAGSIPLAFADAFREGQLKNGDVVACAGFGAGLSWGAAVFKWQGGSGPAP